MPYYIRKDDPECKSGWAVIGAEGKLHGCHKLKTDAIKQAVAISIATNEPYKGDWAHKDKNK